LKNKVLMRLLLWISVIFYVLLLFCFSQKKVEKEIYQNSTSETKIVNKNSFGIPVRLKIPTIDVEANIESFGVDSKGEMEVPDNTVDVGWFGIGPRPGEIGSAVMAGHLDGNNGETGVFNNLDKLKPGDKIYVEDNKKTLINFVVRETRTYDPGYAEDVFSSNDKAHLNLITCDGIWNGIKKSYSKRLVVFTDLSTDE
jgi:LPXTG-site transpeptidase (sortase) family protein